MPFLVITIVSVLAIVALGERGIGWVMAAGLVAVIVAAALVMPTAGEVGGVIAGAYTFASMTVIVIAGFLKLAISGWRSHEKKLEEFRHAEEEAQRRSEAQRTAGPPSD